MEIIPIIGYSALLAAALAFMPFIKPLADKLFPLENEKSPGRAGTRTKGCRKMTQAVYHFEEEIARCYKRS